MLITSSQPVDVLALRARWAEIVACRADRKTQRVAQRCCWANIAADLMRYGQPDRERMLDELFEGETGLAVEVDRRLAYEGAAAAAAWLEEELGVRI